MNEKKKRKTNSKTIQVLNKMEKNCWAGIKINETSTHFTLILRKVFCRLDFVFTERWDAFISLEKCFCFWIEAFELKLSQSFCHCVPVILTQQTKHCIEKKKCHFSPEIHFEFTSLSKTRFFSIWKHESFKLQCVLSADNCL